MNSKVEHTPGPWRHQLVNGDYVYRVYTDAAVVAGVDKHENMLLIAACPDLLSACVAALEALNTAPRFNVGTTTSYRIASQVEAAIAKAGGQK